MTRIDHAAEARRLIELSSVQPDTDSARAVSDAAQVHATLALVEQQRIANLVAWLDHASGDAYGPMGAEIAAALGIGDDQ